MIDDDEAFWQEVISDIRPIPQQNRVEIVRRSKKFQTERLQTVPLKIYRHDVGLNTSADIDKNTIRRLKREEFSVEGVLDLHGYNEQQAFEAVHQFITHSFLCGKRCVIIVTGKGLPHPDEDIFAAKGILRERVPQWLKSDELSHMILTYIHPSARLGGQGALYILLRRRREAK